MAASRPRLFLIDTFGLIFRAFYGRARSAVPSMRTSTGIPSEAVYVFTNMLNRLLAEHRPEYAAAIWEGEGPTFRDHLFEEYKANREEMPGDLAQQLPYIQRLLEAFRTPVLSQDGYEADDVIGALARKAAAEGMDVYLVTSDKDLSQLVSDHVFLLNPMKDDMVYDPASIEEWMGVPPEKVVDLLALKGDSVDNIPGAPGIGDKGARDLIREFGSVEAAIENAEKVKRKTYRESLQQNKDQILLSKKLAALATGVDLDVDWEKLRRADADEEALRKLYRELEFQSLLSKMGGAANGANSLKVQELSSESEVAEWLAKHEGEIVSLALAADGQARLLDEGLGLSAGSGEARAAPGEQLASEALRGFLEDPARPKRIHDSKTGLRAFGRRGIALNGVADDTMLAAFLVDSSRVDYSFDKAVARVLAIQPQGGLGEAAGLTRRMGEQLGPQIDELGLRNLYESIELPLSAVLAGMEEAGVLLDSGALAKLSQKLESEIESLTARIHDLAGAVFNVNSPKQLGKILFEDLNLPAPPRRGKTKSLSTASDVLESLAQDHEIASRVLELRQLTKLKGTYIDALPALVNRDTGRLHTTFNPTGSATGRLSSSNPNLQNIPIRTELGREIRAAFIARPGWKLLAADYSQIELRILAHLSGDAVLLDAFRKGEDIHTRTAAEVFQLPPEKVGPEERRRAKAVNFGIVYGLSAYGLSQQLGIAQADARTYIDAYFELYAGVKKFIDEAIEQARQTGVSTTLFGRRRPITDLDSKNPAARGFAERTAINSPIQGAAADLIKLAMVRVDQRLREQRGGTLMVLQVHDELLFEGPEKEIDGVAKMVRTEMEGVYELNVPLVVDVKAGSNWRDMKAL